MTRAFHETHGSAEEALPRPCTLLKPTGPQLWAASPLDVRPRARCPCQSQSQSQSQSGPQAAPPDSRGQPG